MIEAYTKRELALSALILVGGVMFTEFVTDLGAILMSFIFGVAVAGVIFVARVMRAVGFLSRESMVLGFILGIFLLAGLGVATHLIAHPEIFVVLFGRGP